MALSWKPLLAVLALGASLAGCAREAQPPEVPGMRSAQAPLKQRHGAHKGVMSLSIPDGAPCLSWLAERRIAFRELDEKPGMTTPIVVTGPIGGVRYESAGKQQIV